ncbi:MAG: HlyD family secretion protein [Pseudomonadota bacterium]
MNRTKALFTTAKFWVLSILGLVVILVAYYIAADRVTPYTGDAYVQALVVQISPQVQGQVIQVHVANGSQVKKGAPLYQIDPRPYQHKVDHLKALLVQTQAEIRQVESQLEAQKSIISEREADVHLAQKTFDRISKLAEDSFAAQQQLDDATDRLSANKALLRQAQAESRRLDNRLDAIIDGDHAEVQQVRAQLSEAELRLSETTVSAPVDGVIDNVQLQVGTYVDVGQPVLSFVDTTRWWIVANFKENALSVIKPGQKVLLGYVMYPGQRFEGRVESIGRGVSQGQGEASGLLPLIENPTSWISLSQRFQVRIAPAEMGSEHPLRVGASARTVVFTGDNGIMNDLARFWMWIASYLDFIY